MAGYCANPDCTFAHGEVDLKPFQCMKKKLCKWHVKGVCRNGSTCSFAHGQQELEEYAQDAPALPVQLQALATQPEALPVLNAGLPVSGQAQGLRLPVRTP